MFELHSSPELRGLFARKPYQGAPPEQARFVFVGLDANYAGDIDQGPFFSRVREYHHDGVAFWRQHGVHHPFLHSDNPGDRRGGGCPYHRGFARIGFTRQHAHLVSFVELLHVPTVGQSKLQPDDLSTSHLQWLNSIIEGGRESHVFLSRTVQQLMHASGAFGWLPRPTPGRREPLAILFKDDHKTAYSHLHFSAWDRRKSLEATAIRSLLAPFGG